MSQLDLTSVILLITVIVSLVTSIMSILTMAFQRSHNVKVVKPFCNVHKSITKDNIGLSIMNAGLGPMFVKSITLIKSTDETIIDTLKPMDTPPSNKHIIERIRKAQRKLISKKKQKLIDILPMDYKYESFINSNDIYILPPMGEMKVFWFSKGSRFDKIDQVEVISDILREYMIYIEFQDIYEHGYVKTDNLIF